MDHRVLLFALALPLAACGSKGQCGWPDRDLDVEFTGGLEGEASFELNYVAPDILSDASLSGIGEVSLSASIPGEPERFPVDGFLFLETDECAGRSTVLTLFGSVYPSQRVGSHDWAYFDVSAELERDGWGTVGTWEATFVAGMGDEEPSTIEALGGELSDAR